MKLSDPFTKDELITAVGSLQKNLAETFENIPEALFFQKPESGWSLAENIQHMNRVTRLLTLTFSTPKILASVFFGTNSSRARRTMEVAEIYLDALNKGQKSGPFTPGAENPDGNLAERKAELLKDWSRYWNKYGNAIENWNEEQLDRIQMPHPFLGKIPAREMYMIGILHPVHHSRIVAKRIGETWRYF